MSRQLEDVRLGVMMPDGIEIADRIHVVALGITTATCCPSATGPRSVPGCAPRGR